MFANNVTINSQIGGDAFIIANNVTVGEQGYVFSNLFTMTSNLTIKGVVYDVYGVARTTDVTGYVYRDLKLISGTLNISGIIGRNAFVDCEGAGIQDYIMYAGRFIVTVIILWLLGLWLAPKFMKNSTEVLSKRTGAVIGYGILTPIVLLIVPILLLLVSVTINIGIIGLAVLFLLVMIGSPIFVITINKLICNKLKIEKNIGVFGLLIVSSLIFWLLGLIPILGTLIIYVSAIFGTGTIVANLLPKKEKKDKKTVEVEKVDDKKEEK